MEFETAFNSFLLCIFLLLTFIQWEYFWFPYCIDNFRSKIFNLRGKLFEAALEDKLSFNDPAYKEMWNRLNSLLRYTHRITPINFIVFSFYSKDVIPLCNSKRDQFDEQIKKIKNTSGMETLISIRSRARGYVQKFFYRSNPLGYLFILGKGCIDLFRKTRVGLEREETISEIKNRLKASYKELTDKRLIPNDIIMASIILLLSCYQFGVTRIKIIAQYEQSWINQIFSSQIEEENTFDKYQTTIRESVIVSEKLSFKK